MITSIIDLSALIFVRVQCRLMCLLPERAAFLLARTYVGIFLFFVPNYHKVAKRNLKLVFPEKSFEERELIRKRSYRIMGVWLMDFARTPLLTRERVAKIFPNYPEVGEEIDRARQGADGAGVILAMMHFGSPDLLSQAHCLLYGPTAVLSRAFPLPRLSKWWNDRREHNGNILFDRKGGYRKIQGHLKKGNDVAVLFDQNVRGGHAVFVDLFGIKAATTRALALAAIRTGAPIVFGAGAEVSRSPREFKVAYKTIDTLRDSDISNEEKISRIVRALHVEIENVIRDYPEQWFWVHRRFKTRPPGELETIYDLPDSKVA